LKDVEGVEPKVEGAESALIEKTDATSTQGQPTVVKVTETPEFQKAVSKGLESLTRQLSLQQAEANKERSRAAQLEAEQKYSQALVDSLKEEMNKLATSTEDPELRQAYVSKIAALERDARLAKKEADADRKVAAAEAKEHNLEMALAAKQFMEETGIPLEQIEGCSSVAEMEVKALRFKLTQPSKTEEEEPKPKFDSGLSSGGNVSGIPTDINKFKEWVENVSQEEYEKLAPQINAMRRQGKFK